LPLDDLHPSSDAPEHVGGKKFLDQCLGHAHLMTQMIRELIWVEAPCRQDFAGEMSRRLGAEVAIDDGG
jgi:hypothetical protein